MEYLRLKSIILTLKGLSIKEISEKLDVVASTIYTWKNKYRNNSHTTLPPEMNPIE